MFRLLTSLLLLLTTSGCSPRLSTGNIPTCITEIVKNFQAEAITNPPRKILKYQYQSKVVYYVPAICCDQFSDLYDENCKLLGHPNGGYTGSGDGKFTDFQNEAIFKETVWEDKRKN